ncbi:MAG: class I SAM-dependent methyltransferase [Actinomycetota bacterium]
MSVGPEVFGEDYLYFYDDAVLSSERDDREAQVVWDVLGLTPGADVLDLACGHGRIANRLADRGATVIGLDRDPYFLEIARSAGSDAEFVEGDMRGLPWDEPRFDAVVLWFTAFGYFDERTNADVLRGIRRVLREGGRLAVELNHLPRILATFQRQSWIRHDDDVALDEHEFEPDRSVMRTKRTYVRGGTVREIEYEVRMYMPAELRELLLGAGFSRVDLLGGDGNPLVPEARRLIAVAHV